MEKYNFKGKFDLSLIINDSIRDGKRSFIVLEKENALIGILHNTFDDFEDIYFDADFKDGKFIGVNHMNDALIYPYFFKIIDKKDIGEWISKLKNERKIYNKSIMKLKDQNKKESSKNRYEVFTFVN